MQRRATNDAGILREIFALGFVRLGLAIRLRRESRIIGPAWPLEGTEFIVLHILRRDFATLFEQHDSKTVARQLARD